MSTSNVAGSATLTLYSLSTAGALSATTHTVTGWNLSKTAVAASKWLMLKQESLTGRYLIDFEDCTT